MKAIEAHSAVREAAVIGLPDERLGAVPAAAIILKARQATPTTEELTSFLRQTLLPYEIPVRLLFVAEMPRTASLKPALPALRELLSGAESPRVEAPDSP